MRQRAVLAGLMLIASSVSAQMPDGARACRMADTLVTGDARIVVTPDTMIALINLLQAGDYATLEQRFASYDSAARADFRNEDAWHAAYRAFNAPTPGMAQDVDRWVDSSPEAPWPRLIRAYYRQARSAAADRYSDELVDDKGAERVMFWRAEALRDVQHELSKPNPHIQAFLVLSMIAQGYDFAASIRALDSALARSPYSAVIHEQYARALRPTWGGTRASLQAFVERAQLRADSNPRLRALLGYPAWDRADIKHDNHADTVEARRQLALAMKHGITGDFMALRATLNHDHEKFSRSIADFNCAIALNPWRAEWITWRGTARIKLGASFDGERAVQLQRDGIRDLNVARALQPYNETTLWGFSSTITDVRQDLVQEHYGVTRSAARTVRDIVSDLWGWGVFGLFCIGNFFAWRRNNYFIPRYIHVLAVLALGVIVWLNWMWVYQAEGTFTVRRFVVVLFFPFIVYFIYITYGGFRTASRGLVRWLRRLTVEA